MSLTVGEFRILHSLPSTKRQKPLLVSFCINDKSANKSKFFGRFFLLPRWASTYAMLAAALKPAKPRHHEAAGQN